jgi:hypothetical protein
MSRSSAPISTHYFQCIECGAPAGELYKEYSPGNIRLSVCDTCHKTIDKFVEYEFVLIALDLVLMKPQAYRHVLYNRNPVLNGSDIWKTVVLSVLLDAYMKWVLRHAHELEGNASIELHKKLDMHLSAPGDAVTDGMKIVFAALIELATYFIGIVVAMRYSVAVVGSPLPLAKIGYQRLLVVVLSTGFSKLLLAMLMMIWHFEYSFIMIISVLVLISNVEAVRAFLHTTTWRACAVVAVALGVRLAARLSLHAIDPSMALGPEHPSKLAGLVMWVVH